MNKILDNTVTNGTNLFLGDYSGFQRYDNPIYPQISKLEQVMRGNYWNPEEISCRTDHRDFFELPASVQDTMIMIWFYQTMMDSTQNRGIELTLNTIVSNPECEALLKTWSYFELIHSISYSHIIQSIFPNSKNIFDNLIGDKTIEDRLKTELTSYAQFNSNNATMDEVVELFVTIYMLEGIKFYVSFLMTYVTQDKYQSIPGATRIIRLINHDEDLHTLASEMILKIIRKESKYNDDALYVKLVNEKLNQVYMDEYKFASLIFSRNIQPIEFSVVEDFLNYYKSERFNRLMGNGVETEKPEIVKWFELQKDLNSIRVNQQESDMSVYNIGVLEDDF